MHEIEWFRSHVEKLLRDGWEQCQIEVDEDGDFPFRFGTAACFVRVVAGPPLAVRVVATAATGVRRSAKLLTELNELNAHARSVTTYWCSGAVLVEKTLDATAVNDDTLLRACGEVGAAADSVGTLIAGVFDGATPFGAVPVDQDQDPF